MPLVEIANSLTDQSQHVAGDQNTFQSAAFVDDEQAPYTCHHHQIAYMAFAHQFSHCTDFGIQLGHDYFAGTVHTHVHRRMPCW